jgi:signal transduction histidine kinase
MFSLARTLEILLFALCNFAPYVGLTYYIFQKHFRYSKAVTTIGCILLFLVQFVTRYWSALHGINTSITMSILRLVIILFGYAILFDQRLGKILYIELIFANMGNFILIAAVCLERNLFPNIEHALYCWHTSVVMLLLHLIITLPWALEVRRYFIPMLDNRRVGNEWNYYWLVPTVFYIIWQYQINGGTKTGLENIQNPYNVVFLFIINFGSLLIYYIMLKLDGQLVRNLELEEQQRYRDLEQVAFQTLQERMQETRRMRHDLRHHIHMLNYYLEVKDYDKLQEYVNSYRESIPDMEHIRFCDNRMVNNILFFFASQTKEHKIDFQAQLSIGEHLKITDHELSVLLGNLLENAIEACMEQKNTARRIIVKGKGDENSLIVTIDNTCENEIKRNKKGALLSTKAHGNGIGVNSAKKIVERYNGFFSAEKREEMFCVSFMLSF